MSRFRSPPLFHALAHPAVSPDRAEVAFVSRGDVRGAPAAGRISGARPGEFAEGAVRALLGGAR